MSPPLHPANPPTIPPNIAFTAINNITLGLPKNTPDIRVASIWSLIRSCLRMMANQNNPADMNPHKKLLPGLMPNITVYRKHITAINHHCHGSNKDAANAVSMMSIITVRKRIIIVVEYSRYILFSLFAAA